MSTTTERPRPRPDEPASSTHAVARAVRIVTLSAARRVVDEVKGRPWR